jgi:putative membrane protein
LLVDAAIIVVMARMMGSVDVRSYGTAVAVALVIGLLNATVGFLLRGILNLFTLFLLGFLVRLFVTAIMLKIADRFFSGFHIRGFGPAFIIAIVLAVVGSLLGRLLWD